LSSGYYRVWNVEQCELPEKALDKLPKVEIYQHDPIEAAERIIVNMPNPPEIEYAGSKAFYSLSADRITLPPRELFISAEEHLGTWAHEASRYADIGITATAQGIPSGLTAILSPKRLRSVHRFTPARS